MRSDVMMNSHQSSAPWEWSLAPATASLLPAADRPRWLAVTAGRVWLTRSGAGPHAADVWLEAGERHALPAGSEWVIEGWPQARVALLEAAPARRVSARGGARVAWAGWRPLAAAA